MSYGFEKIPKDGSDYSECFQKNFHHFIALQKIANKITGSGSYLFDGNTSFDYYPGMYLKQKAFFDICKTKKNLLEIGVYAGHSALLALIANPDLIYTGIDICYYNFTETCVEYLSKQFPNRVKFYNANSIHILKQLLSSSIDSPQSYNLIHVDGDHGDLVVEETKIILQTLPIGTTVIYDDFDGEGPQKAIQKYSRELDIVSIPNCDWRNCITKIKRNIYPTPLCTIADHYGTDKSPGKKWHSYTPIYHSLFSNKRNTATDILEIGIGGVGSSTPKGASIKMWRDYFPNATVYAIDIAPENMFSENRIKTFICDQGSREQLAQTMKDKSFDIIIDDGSHFINHQVISLFALFPYLKSGGYYAVEDILRCPELFKGFPRTVSSFIQKFATQQEIDYLISNLASVDDLFLEEINLSYYGYKNDVDDHLTIFKKK